MFERLEIEGEKRFWEIAPPQFGFVVLRWAGVWGVVEWRPIGSV